MRLAENLNISQQPWAARQWRVRLAEYRTFIALCHSILFRFPPLCLCW